LGTICPKEGKGAALVLPHCDTEAMSLHVKEIETQRVTQGSHAVLFLDQAGWHLSHRLIVPKNITLLPLPPKCPELNPKNITLLPLPPKCPELNPMENIQQFLRDNWLSNLIFQIL
jgi:hypothetical protein